MKKAVALLLALTVLLAGCGVLEPVDSTASTGTSAGETAPTGPVMVDFAQTDGDMFTERDERTAYTEQSSAVISLNGDSVSCNSNKVSVSGTTVTISGEGTYILRGTLNDGMIVVNAGEQDKPQIVLDGASVTSGTSAALYVLQADKVFVTLAEGTENTLANGGSFTAIDENNIDGAVFSKQDLTFNGSGSLTINSPTGHGIVCKDDLVITGGRYTVNSASHGLDANDSVRIKNGSFSIDAGKDGIHAEDADNPATGFVYVSGGTMDIEAEGDGISAALYAQIENGQIDVLAGGGYENGESHSSGGFGDFMGGGMGPGGMLPGGHRPGERTVEATTTDDSGTSMKGLKADGGILISNGTLNMDSADDGIHSNAAVTINGGTMTIASGDDGIHGETELTITAGTIEITESYEGLEAQNMLVSGGKITLKATDDGLNAAGGVDSSGAGGRDQMFGGGRPGGMGGAGNGSIVITGGELYVQASGDGMDANGYLEITGGYTVVCGPNQGDTATLDYDTSATISGGVFIGTGASGMAQSFSANTQGVIAVRADGQPAGVKITVSDSDGKELVSYQPELAFSVVIFSTPELVSGQSYRVTVGDIEGDIAAD